MPTTFANLPNTISTAIETILTQQSSSEWINRAISLHDRYTSQQKGRDHRYISDSDDAVAYLALRVCATYAQTYASLRAVKEILPSWKPLSVLDLGSGPGTGMWAAKNVWDTIVNAKCIDNENAFLQLGKQISDSAGISIQTEWEKKDLQPGIDSLDNRYDVVIIGNVLNELSSAGRDKLLGQAFNAAKGVLVIVEAGTPGGSLLVSELTKKMQDAGSLIAPYIGETLVNDEKYWLHFSQKFIRPDFLRRLRQHMRDSSEMASDWEDAKFCYTAFGKFPKEVTAWGRCVGQVHIQKGFLEVPILTNDNIVNIKVLKRYKEQYHKAKELKWGEIIYNKDKIIA